MVNLYMLIFPTPLYLSKIVHMENAAADINPKYKINPNPSIVKVIPFSTPKNPAIIKNNEPVNN